MRAAFALGLMLTTAAGAAAQQGTPPPVTSSPAAQPLVTLTLRTADGRKQFHPGETIPIELEFASTIAGRFVVDGATYDRSGRLTIDTYKITPDRGVVDPLLDYLASFGDFLGGGIRGMGVLGDKPFVVKLQLNEWFRFDEPGIYALSVRSGRVIDESAGSLAMRGAVPVESNTVPIEILPRDDGWSRTQVAALVARLDRPPSSPSVNDPQEACRALRFLGTNDAVDAMVRRYDQKECQFEFMVGLFGARDRAHVVSEMAARLDAPDQSVSESYLRTLAILTVYQQHPEFSVPQTPQTMGRWPVSSEIRKHPDLLEATRAAYAAKLSANAASKNPKARALTLASAFESAPPNDPAERDAMRDQVTASFLDLPVDVQSRFLEYRWPALASPAMEQVLVTLVDSADRKSFTGSALADLALRRLYAVAPDQARPRMLAQIKEPPQGATILTLGTLPERELPDLDQALAANVINPPVRGSGSLEIRAALLERYATRAALATVLPWIEARSARMACAPLASLLAYVARVDPSQGQALLGQALSARAGITFCFRSVLVDIAKIRMTPAVEAVAIAHLTDPDPEVVRNAAEALGAAGSPAAREPLLIAFEKWHATWNGRESELAFRQATENPNAPQAMTENAFWQALTLGYGWHATSADIARVQQLCVTTQCRQQVGNRIAQADQTLIRISSLSEPFASIYVAQHTPRSLAELDHRLSQYPKGTVFTLELTQLDPRIAAEVKRMAEAHGLVIR